MTSPPSPRAALRVDIFGVVQGVGFRPAVFRLAGRFGLAGWVKNDARGVRIHIEGGRADLADFLRAIGTEPPPLARIERLVSREAGVRGFRSFTVRRSRQGEGFVFISPDIAVCPACRADVADPGNRRFRYPFTNCTNCGPRYTIVKALPYDRLQTTMAGFPLCPDCAREYRNPADRRYHAQPIACPVCGPRIVLKDARTGRVLSGGIEKTAELIRRGRIAAVKGLGGFHLVGDPWNAAAVARLRRIKARTSKPIALMARDLAAVRKVARLSEDEKRLLVSDRKPIVLLKKRIEIPGIAPGLDEVGIMLAYTPLHDLLLENLGLVMATSSNPKDAPIIKDEDEGLAGLCDVILGHDRPIQMRVDDSVVKVVRGKPLFVRRARGFVPYPQRVPDAFASAPPILALGAELKVTVSIHKNGYVVTSPFLGDLDDYRNRLHFEEAVEHLTRLFDVRPAAVVSDLHPDFHTTRIAERMGLPHFRIQHHWAHVLAVLLEHGRPPDEKVLGIVWDGYGHGEDGTPWGGEFLIAGYEASERYARFEPIPLPGGDLAAKEPWRMALSYLRALDPLTFPDLPALRTIPERRRRAVWEMLGRGVRSPAASSCGRLFDAVSAMTGLAPESAGYEAEAAMRLESAVSPGQHRPYGFDLRPGTPKTISFLPTIRGLLNDLEHGAAPAVISARFHETLASCAADIARKARDERAIEAVVLGGGVFLNRRLLERTERVLEMAGFRVYRPTEYSPNDESISIGQIAYALARLRRKSRVNP